MLFKVDSLTEIYFRLRKKCHIVNVARVDWALPIHSAYIYNVDVYLKNQTLCVIFPYSSLSASP